MQYKTRQYDTIPRQEKTHTIQQQHKTRPNKTRQDNLIQENSKTIQDNTIATRDKTMQYKTITKQTNARQDKTCQ